MIYIQKAHTAPKKYHDWYKRNPKRDWKRINAEDKNILRNILLEEQGYVCCFCGSMIGKISNVSDILQEPVDPNKNNIRNHNIQLAHIIPRRICKIRKWSQLNYRKICASCDSENKKYVHCDIAQKDKLLFITPLKPTCLSYFSFDSSGKIKPNQKNNRYKKNKAKRTIERLKLDCLSLNNKRRLAIQDFENDLGVALNDGSYATKYQALTTKDGKGRHNEFYFIVIANYSAPESIQ